MANYTVLLIDYEPRSVERTQRVLVGAGYQVVLASDGVTGMETFDKIKPDLVLVEAMIPKKHGFEVCQELKKTPHGKSTPIIITTAVYKGRKYRSQALHLHGCDEYLEKPIKDDDLLSTVRGLLGDDSPLPDGPKPPREPSTPETTQSESPAIAAPAPSTPPAVASSLPSEPPQRVPTQTSSRLLKQQSTKSASAARSASASGVASMIGDLSEDEINATLDAILPTTGRSKRVLTPSVVVAEPESTGTAAAVAEPPADTTGTDEAIDAGAAEAAAEDKVAVARQAAVAEPPASEPVAASTVEKAEAEEPPAEAAPAEPMAEPRAEEPPAEATTSEAPAELPRDDFADEALDRLGLGSESDEWTGAERPAASVEAEAGGVDETAEIDGEETQDEEWPAEEEDGLATTDDSEAENISRTPGRRAAFLAWAAILVVGLALATFALITYGPDQVSGPVRAFLGLDSKDSRSPATRNASPTLGSTFRAPTPDPVPRQPTAVPTDTPKPGIDDANASPSEAGSTTEDLPEPPKPEPKPPATRTEVSRNERAPNRTPPAAPAKSESAEPAQAEPPRPAPAIRTQPVPASVTRTPVEATPARTIDPRTARTEPTESAKTPETRPPVETNPAPAARPGQLFRLGDVDQPPVSKNLTYAYTPRALALKEEGTVVLTVLVREDGTVGDVKLVQGIDGSDLTPAAMKAAWSWTYEPAVKDGVPVRVWTTERLEFRR